MSAYSNLKAHVAGTIVGVAIGASVATHYAEIAKTAYSYVADHIKNAIFAKEEPDKITDLEKRISILEKQTEKQAEGK